MKKYLKPLLLIILWVFLAFWIYIFWYIQAGLAFIPPHYHANFAMYVNWEQVDFSLDKYMEDVAGCSLTGDMLPKDRVHLHENNGETIHIHHEWASWGHFFSNNDFTFWENFLSNDEWEIFLNSESSEISFILNWEEVKNPFNKLINSQDRLLVNYWGETEPELQERFESVSDNAGEYNSKYDPGSCGGTNENGIMVIIQERINSLFWHQGH